jgi:general secretion pathway protein D
MLRFVAALCCVLLVGVQADARTRKGDKLLKLGQKAEAEKHYDVALQYFDQALDTDPQDPEYLLNQQRGRSEAAQAEIAEGRKLQNEQKLDEALVQFQKAFLADPSSEIALQEIRQTNQMIKERSALPAGTPVLTPAEKARQAVEKRINSLEGPPTLRPLNNQITSLKMNNQPTRVLYETVSKLAGINVLFDPSGVDTAAGKNFNLDLNNATLEEALNYIALVTHTFWKPVSHNAIFVTQETEQKRQEYQDEVVKVFYIQNATTQNELSEIFNGVRTGAKLTTGIFQIPSQDAIVVRGNTDQVALAEKLVHDLDQPKSEVTLDVVIMSVNRDRTRTLGAALAGQTGGLKIPINFTPRNPVLFGNTGTNNGTTTNGTTTNGTTTNGTTTNGTTTNGTTTNGTTTTGTTTTGTSGINSGVYGGGTTTDNTAISLAQLGHVASSDFSTTLPGALIQALLSDASTRILQRPQLRATDGGTATLTIGSRIPYVSGSLNSAVATPGSIPYATTQFQQVDVGVKIEIKPRVNAPNDITLHIKAEISNVQSTTTIAGVQQPIIGQTVNEADVRVKDGQVSVLGGLNTNEQDDNNSGIPGLTNMPVLGYLFGTRVKTRNKDSTLIALIPHIVRAPNRTDIADDGVDAGTERFTRVIRSAAGAPESATPASTAPSGSAAPKAAPPPQPNVPQVSNPPVPPNPNPPAAVPGPGGVPPHTAAPTPPAESRPPFRPPVPPQANSSGQPPGR